MSASVKLTDAELRTYSPGAQAGTLVLRGMASRALRALALANPWEVDKGMCEAFVLKAYADVRARTGPRTNPSWVTSTAAVEAYNRHLIDETELDGTNR